MAAICSLVTPQGAVAVKNAVAGQQAGDGFQLASFVLVHFILQFALRQCLGVFLHGGVQNTAAVLEALLGYQLGELGHLVGLFNAAGQFGLLARQIDLAQRIELGLFVLADDALVGVAQAGQAAFGKARVQKPQLRLPLRRRAKRVRSAQPGFIRAGVGVGRRTLDARNLCAERQQRPVDFGLQRLLLRRLRPLQIVDGRAVQCLRAALYANRRVQAAVTAARIAKLSANLLGRLVGAVHSRDVAQRLRPLVVVLGLLNQAPALGAFV